MVKIGEISIEITASTSKLRANLAQASSLIRDFSLLSEGLTGGISEAFRQVSDVAIKGLQIGIAALVGSFTLAANAGANFEDEMMRAFVIMKEGGNATADSLAQMTTKALELGRESLFSAIDAAEGMQVLARAGFNTKEVLDSIGPVMNLAISDNLELAESADYVISALRSFNFSTSEARRVTDIMALGASKASMSVSELADAFKYVAPVAAGMGISIEETVAAIGLLSDAGLKGSMAGTTLRRAFSELISPTAKSAKILEGLGVNAVTASGKLRPFADILRDLKTKGMSAAQAMDVFGQRGGPGMIALLTRGSGALSELTNDLKNAQGAAEEMAQAFRTTVKGRTRDLIASLVDLGLAFSEKFKKPLAEAIFFVRNFVVDLVNIGNRMNIFNTIIKGMQEALKPISGLIKELAGDFKKWLATLTAKDVLQFFSGIKKGIEGFIGSFKKGELGAIVKDTLNIFIGLGKMVIGTVKLIAEAWLALPKGIRDVLRPIMIVVALVIQLFGGILNIVFLMVALNALWASLGLKVTLSAALLAGLKPLLLFIWQAVLVIGIAIAAWTLGSFIGELSIVKGYFAAMFILIGAIGPSLKLAALSFAAFQQPWLLFNKQFRTDMAETFEELKIKAGALAEIDWLGKGKEKEGLGGKAGPEKGGGYMEIGGVKIDLETLKANEEVDAIKKMINQSDKIENILGPSQKTGLLTLLQGRLDDLEKIVMEQEGNITALSRQTIKPEADRRNKARIGAGLE
jgi:TP901 family phage tail tape measure protein